MNAYHEEPREPWPLPPADPPTPCAPEAGRLGRKLASAAGLLTLLGTLLWLPPAHGQPGQAPGQAQAAPEKNALAQIEIDRRPARPLTLDEALVLARKNNRDLLGARERLRGAHADVERAWSTLLPKVNAQGKYTFNSPEVSVDFSAFAKLVPPNLASSFPSGPAIIVPQNQLDAAFTATLPLIAPAAYPALQGARHGYRGQQKQLEVTEAQLLQSVASSFFAAAGADELVAARSNAIQVATQTLDNARARLEAGVVNRVEVTRAELALIQAQQRLLEAEDSRGAAYRVLATLILVRDPIRVVPPSEPVVEARSDGELVMQALQQRPEVPALQASICASDSQALSAALRWLPNLSAFGTIRLTNASGFSNGRYDFYLAGLQLDWALFDGFERDATRHSFEAQAKSARFQLQQLRDTIADDVLNTRRQVSTRKEGLKAAQRSVGLAQETLDLVRIQHDAGTATQLDLLTAQDQLVQAQVGLAQARFDLALADINLRRLIGAFPATLPAP